MSESTSEKEQLMRDYLLGKLGAEEFALREDIWFGNDAESEQLEAVRADLIDDFLTDALSAGEKYDFEQNFLSSPHNVKLAAITKIHRGLIDEKTIADFDKAAPVNSAIEQDVSGWQRIRNSFSFRMPQMALVASILIVVFGLVFAVQLLRRGENEVVRVSVPTLSDTPMQISPSVSPTSAPLPPEIPVSKQPTPGAEPKNDPLPITPASPPPSPKIRAVETRAPTPAMPAPKQRNSIATLALVLGVRGNSAPSPNRLELDKEMKTVQLSYEMPVLMQSYKEFRVLVIEQKSGRTVYEQITPDLNFRQKGTRLTASLPAKNLETGSYQLVLRAASPGIDPEVLTRYEFKVMKK
jgi:hypothetical protein